MSEAVKVENVDRHHGKEVVSYGEDGLAVYADGTHEEHPTPTTDEDGGHRQMTETEHSGEGSMEQGDNFGGHPDSQPYGPQSIGIDFTFPSAQHVYGIPEHATPLALPTTIPGIVYIIMHIFQLFSIFYLHHIF